MAANVKEFTVEPGSDIDLLLNEAIETPLVLIKDGRRFTIRQDPVDIWAGYDAEAAIRGIREAAGGWKGLVDGEEFKAYIRERRLTKNRKSFRL